MAAPKEVPQKPIRIVSGMRTTGRLHLGHYFGVLANYLKLQEQHECFFMAADLHALTTGDLSKANLAQNTLDMFLDWLAVGIDPQKATLLVQSEVPQHAQLFALFSMLAPMGWLERNPTFKEQRAELGEKATGSLGFLSYPVLQTVDVAIYKGTHVPVGEDQKPHLELGRELIRKFHHTFKCQIFPEFQPMLTPTPKLPGTDGRKMSKGYGNAIGLTEDPDSVRKKVRSMLTDVRRPRREDPGHPEDCPVFAWHQLITEPERVDQIAIDCRAARLGCGEDKADLADRIIAWQAPFVKKRLELEKDLGAIHACLEAGNAKARQVAEATLAEAHRAAGLWISDGSSK